MLKQAIDDYLLWMIEKDFSPFTWQRHERELKYLAAFVKRQKIHWEAVFTPSTLKAFLEERANSPHTAWAVRGIWKYLFERGRIKEPLPKKQELKPLPKIYEDYLLYYAQKVLRKQVIRARAVLCALHDYLEKHNISITGLKICHLDTFLVRHNAAYSPPGARHNCCCLRGFLVFLYRRGELKKNFAPLLRGVRRYELSKPPKFLQPQQVQRLFSELNLSCPKDLRTNAMLHLAYTLGLRPIEISLIKMDDISFQRGEVKIFDRKNQIPTILPLPENTIKALAAYIVAGRPKSNERAVFLKLQAPYSPIGKEGVSKSICNYMRRLHLPSSAYWLRHTYAQNLLESGASIFEIKEMLGHEQIRTAQKYLHVHIKLMREVILNETL